MGLFRWEECECSNLRRHLLLRFNSRGGEEEEEEEWRISWARRRKGTRRRMPSSSPSMMMMMMLMTRMMRCPTHKTARPKGRRKRKRRGKEARAEEGKKAKTTTSYYAERRELALRQLKEMEPKTMVIGALSLACCVKLMQTVSQRLFGVNQPGRGLKHRCNRCAKKDARVKCTRCKNAWYCSKECLKAAWKLEICECC